LQIVAYVNSGFFEIGFVLHKTGPICTCGRARGFSTIVEQVGWHAKFGCRFCHNSLVSLFCLLSPDLPREIGTAAISWGESREIGCK